MSDSTPNEAVEELKGLLEAMIEKLSGASAKEGEGRPKPLFFPDGINDIFAKLTSGSTTVEVEISGASQIHTAGTLMHEREEHRPDQIEAAIRPMWAYVSALDGTDTKLMFGTKAFTLKDKEWSYLDLGVPASNPKIVKLTPVEN